MFGLSFLNTPFLIFLSSLALPIIIYLITKKKPQQIIFSSIRFIKESVQQRKKRINLKNLLLLLIRLLILLFVILGLSRPVIKTKKGFFSSNHPKTAIAVIIDNSYSMDYLIDTQTELDKAKEITKEINGIINPDDIIVLITRDDKWNKIYASLNYGKFSKDILNKINITPKAISIKSAIALANKALKSSQIINKEIYIITDFQKEDYPKKNEIPITIIKTSDFKYKKNLAITKTFIAPNFTGDKSKRRISFTIKNFSEYKQSDIICRLFLDGKTIAEKLLSLAPFQEKSSYFDVTMENEGWHFGYVKVKNERLEYDNKNYFSFYYKENPSVAIISKEDTFPLSLISILEIYSNDIRILDNDKINYKIFEDFDNIIVYKPFLDEKLVNILKSGKKNKLLFIADIDDDKNLKALYNDLFGVKIDDFVKGKQDYNIDTINRFDRITRMFSKTKNISINGFYKLKSNLSAILLAASNNPIAVKNSVGSILWLFSLDIDNPFMVSSMFPAFAYNCFIETSSFNDEYKNLTVGDKINVKDKKIILPSGKLISVENNVYITDFPGIYEYQNKKTAVNLNYKESDYKQNKILSAKNILVTYQHWKNYIFRNGYGKDIWKYFFLIALILFILEMIIIKSEEKR